jgi:hypothetical protein
VSPGVADELTQLVAHVLAHVPRAGPGDLFDPQYVAWSATVLSAEAQGRLIADGELLAALWRADARQGALEGWLLLHGSLAAFRATAGRALAEVEAAEVAEPAVLRALQRLGPAGELMHAALGLLVDEFVEVCARWIAPWGAAAAGAVAPWLAALAEVVPGFGEVRAELVRALGRRGRALPGRVLIGCVENDGATSAIVALHEYAVGIAEQVDYVGSEWDALVRGARWCGAAPTGLREAHARWIAGLELRGLVDGAVRAGLVAAADGRRILREPARRAELLRS